MSRASRARSAGAKAIHDLVVTGIGVGNDRVVDAPALAGQKKLLAATITRSDAPDDQAALREFANGAADAHRLQRPAGDDVRRGSAVMMRKREENSPLVDRQVMTRLEGP